MFGNLFNLAVDVVSLPVTVVSAVSDELLGTEMNDVVEEIKDVIKID